MPGGLKQSDGSSQNAPTEPAARAVDDDSEDEYMDRHKHKEGEEGEGEEEEFRPAMKMSIRDQGDHIKPPSTDELRSLKGSFAPPPPSGRSRTRSQQGAGAGNSTPAAPASSELGNGASSSPFGTGAGSCVVTPSTNPTGRSTPTPSPTPTREARPTESPATISKLQPQPVPSPQPMRAAIEPIGAGGTAPYILHVHETISARFAGEMKEQIQQGLKIRGVVEALAVQGAPRASFNLKLETVKNIANLQLNQALIMRPNANEPHSFKVELKANAPSTEAQAPTKLKLLRYDNIEDHKPIPLRVVPRWIVTEGADGSTVQRLELVAASNPGLQQVTNWLRTSPLP